MRSNRRIKAAEPGGILGVLLTIAGCAVGPDFTRPETAVPDNWTTEDAARMSNQSAVDGRWWQAFNDATLDRLVEISYRQNLPLQMAGLRIVEARAQLGVITGMQYPQVQEVFANASAVGLPKPAARKLDINRNLLLFQLGFDAAWELDFWGKYGRGVQAETAGLLASVADYYYAVVSLTAEVARAYVTLRTFEVLAEQARENARIQEEGLHIAESRFRNGATSELDIAQATTLWESTRASVPDLLSSAQQARNALATLVGQPAGTVDRWLSGPKKIPVTSAKVAVSVPAEMLRRRPDIRSAEFYAAAQCARIGIAKAELYPSFSLVGTVGLGAIASGRGSSSLFSPDSIFYSVGPRVTWPFFNYGRLKNSVRVEDARFQQLLVNYRNTVLKAAQEVEDALTGYIHSQDALIFQQGSVVAAQRSVEIAITQYQEGATDYERVLDAHRSLLQQQNALARTGSAVATNLIALYKALGGGWELRQGRPYVPETTQVEMRKRTDWGDMLSQPRAPETKSPPAGKP